MNNKVNAKELDKEIQKVLSVANSEAIVLLEDLIDLPIEVSIKLIKCKEMQSEEMFGHLLQEVLLARDKKVLGLKNCEVSKVYAEDLKLDEEFGNHNVDIPEHSEVTVVQGKDQKGKNNILYYYADYENDCANRQQRIFNEHGDIESLSRQTIFSDGRCKHMDDAVIVYQYDKHGNKQVGLYQDDFTGMKYFEYDKTGNVKLKVSRDYIMQKFQENGNTYIVVDGYFVPTSNGFIYKNPVSMFELNSEDMQRAVAGKVSPTKKVLKKSFDAKCKEEVLSTLRAVEPIFESCKAANILDRKNMEKMQKMVGWFSGFAKRLKINPALGTQDNAVKATMRGAVGKTIGNTGKAEQELKTPIEEIKEKEIGNN